MDVLEFYINNVKLKYAPAGWDDGIIQQSRSAKYFTLTEKYTTELTFVKDGFNIILDLFINYGLNAEAILTIKQLNSKTLLYEIIFEGNLDFTTIQITENTIKIFAAEKSILEDLRNKENVEYEIDLTKYQKHTRLTFPKVREYVKFSNTNDNWNTDGQATMNAIQIDSELQTGSIVSYDVMIGSYPVLNYPCVTITKEVTEFVLHFDCYLTYGTPNGGNSGWIYLNARIGADNYVLAQKYYGGAAVYKTVKTEYTIQLTSLAADKNIYLYFTNNSSAEIKISGTTTISANCNVKEATEVYVAPVFNVLEAILNKINPDIVLKSDFFLTPYKSDFNFYLTSGDALRKIPNSKLKISFAKLFNSLNSIFGLALNISGNTVEIEEKQYFFKEEEVYNFGIVKDVKIEVYKEILFNSVKIGYEEQEVNNKNVKYEYNSWQQWELATKNINNNLELISKIRADAYGIIEACLNLEGKITTDSESDNDTFILDLTIDTQTGDLVFTRDYNNSVITGFPDKDGLFNYIITPKRNFLRNSDFIACSLYKNELDIKFQTAYRNANIRIVDVGVFGDLTENTNIIKTECKNALFLPILFTFTTIISKDFNEIIKLNPYGYCVFYYNNKEFKGYIKEVSINPTKKTEATIVLISHKNNNLA